MLLMPDLQKGSSTQNSPLHWFEQDYLVLLKATSNDLMADFIQFIKTYQQQSTLPTRKKTIQATPPGGFF